ncbi:hypothetical protein M5D96_004154, partial [Drosophila gunungcola]
IYRAGRDHQKQLSRLRRILVLNSQLQRSENNNMRRAITCKRAVTMLAINWHEWQEVWIAAAETATLQCRKR